MPIETFDFVNARGSRLSGKIETFEVTPRGWALFAHCFTCGKEPLSSTDHRGSATTRASTGHIRCGDQKGIAPTRDQ